MLNYPKIVIVVLSFFLSSNCVAKEAQWFDLMSFSPWDDSVTYTANIKYPSVTLLELKDNQLAVVVSQVSPDISSRNNDWHQDFRIVFISKNNNRVQSTVAGESIGRSSDAWVSSLTYLPAQILAKKDTLKVILQGKATSELIAQRALDEKKKKEKNDKISNLLTSIPFPTIFVGEQYNFSLNLIGGEQYKSQDNIGKVVLIDFYGTWCAPCKKAWPILRDLRNKYSEDEFQILGVSLQDSKDTVLELIKNESLTWPQALFEDEFSVGAVFKKLGFNGVPHYLLVDQSGVLVGQIKSENLDQEIKKLINSMK
ncbi:TlpA family protein disulfide reductase [Pseudoalteromonas tunicata]|jgi:thiol-disulfide isomerase/thioredoxin|uniref:Putative lipoprotein/thioderoxin n=1 Tax=Pseudoalteromonas tunicata D2 TaxID=87626 RepID=A4CAX8_9GAMM|nr:TlpA disulfide reductase family protein [Pseudoalteromonas tunicata]AXT30718.1 TlpA family protein disulfide reductase [Pseudoalteromonas tunicata]EAR28536.1 putative lipoprotein/thioderoxin [Pseudoalteromonas tunicata D2]